MESMLAAYGSGAARLSSDEGSRILNIDIGGGTAKLAVVEDGQVLATAPGTSAAASVGRPSRSDRSSRCRPASITPTRAGFDWTSAVASTALSCDRRRATRWPTRSSRRSRQAGAATTCAHLYLTRPTRPISAPSTASMFSGGVGRICLWRETRDFGDMGQPARRAIRARSTPAPCRWPLLPADRMHPRDRARRLRVSACSCAATPATISTPGVLLPRRNLPVLQPPFDFSGDIDPDGARRRRSAPIVEAFDVEDEREIALRFPLAGRARL